MREISPWLRELGLDEYSALFAEHKIDFEVLSELTESDLKDLDIPLGHRKKLLKAIAALDGPDAPVPREGSEIPPAAKTGASTDAERRQVTIMFCDLVGSTELSGQMDAEDLRALIAQYQDACRAAIAKYEGFIARYMGDGVLAYFGYPKSHEEDPERAVLAGLALLESIHSLNEQATKSARSELAVRIGIATGLVVVGDLIGEGASRESPVIGETPNIAARLQSLAEPNTIVIANSTHRLTGQAFEYHALGARNLKGVKEPIEAWVVLRQRPVESRFHAAWNTAMTPIVGRQEEIALLLNRWARVKQGDGQVVLISGEPGIGKSRLTEELRASIAADPHVRIGYQCLAHYTNSAFHPVIAQLERAAGIGHRHTADEKLDLLESLLRHSAQPDSSELSVVAELLSIPTGDRYADVHIEPEQRKENTLAALTRQLEYLAKNNSVLCVFEDVHCIDPSTLELLERIVDRASTLPVLVIATCRPGFDASWTGQPHTSLLALSRMDRRQSRAIVDQVAKRTQLPESLLTEIVEKTDGIPLFIEELTRAMLDSSEDALDTRADAEQRSGGSLGIPDTLQDSLMSRLDRLAVGKPLAQVAAALGREFSHELITAVFGQTGREIEVALGELVDAGLVLRRGAGSEASYMFKHALVQDVAYQSLLRSARQELHSRIASVLTKDFPESTELQPEVAARHFTEGGQADRAIVYWRRAGDRASARAAHAEAIGHYSRGIDLLKNIDDEGQRVDAEIALHLGIASSMRVVDRLDEALEALDRAEKVAREHDHAAELAEIHYLRGNLYFPLGKFEECLQEHERSRDIARCAGLLEMEARTLGGLGDAYYQRGRMLTAGKHYSQCIAICQEHGYEQIEVANLAMRGITLMYELNYRDASQDAITGAAHAERVRNLRAEAVSQQVVSYVLTDMERFDEARSASQRAAWLCTQLGSVNLGAAAHAHYGRVLFELGERQQALSMLRHAYASAKESGLNFVGPSILGYLARATDDPRERSQALHEGEALLHQESVSHNYLRFYRFAIEASLETERWDEAERYAAALTEYTRRERLPWADFIIERGRALAAYGRGDRSATTIKTISRLRKHAQSCDFNSAVHALDAVLSEMT